MILERIDKSGHVIDCHAFPGDILSLGRGYNNDLIVTDPYVDAHHLHLEFDPERNCFVLTDLGSKNGVRLEDNVSPPVQPGETVTLESGAVILVGKTRYRLLKHNHPVPPALVLSSWEPVYGILGTWRAFTLIIAMVFGLETLSAYWDKPYSNTLYKDLLPSLYLMFLAVGYGLAWVMIARVQRHEGRFLTHANLILLVMVAVALYRLIEPVLGFNLEWILLGGYLSTVLACLVLFLAVYVSCYLSTGLSAYKRLGVSLLVPGIVLLGTLVSEVNKPDFQARPDYRITLVSPFWQFRAGDSQEDFLQAVKGLYKPPGKAALDRQ